MPTRNVTLSLPEDVERRAKVFAAQRETSMPALVRDLLSQLVGDGTSCERLWAGEEACMASAAIRVGDGVVSRDELHRS